MEPKLDHYYVTRDGRIACVAENRTGSHFITVKIYHPERRIWTESLLEPNGSLLPDGKHHLDLMQELRDVIPSFHQEEQTMSDETTGPETVRKEMARRLENGEDVLDGLQLRDPFGNWQDVKRSGDLLEAFLRGHSKGGEFRYRPATIEVNGYEVPAPVEKGLEMGQTCFLPDPTRPNWYGMVEWEGDEYDYFWLRRGLVYLDGASVIKRAKAMVGINPESED